MSWDVLPVEMFCNFTFPATYERIPLPLPGAEWNVTKVTNIQSCTLILHMYHRFLGDSMILAYVCGNMMHTSAFQAWPMSNVQSPLEGRWGQCHNNADTRVWDFAEGARDARCLMPEGAGDARVVEDPRGIEREAGNRCWLIRIPWFRLPGHMAVSAAGWVKQGPEIGASLAKP